MLPSSITYKEVEDLIEKSRASPRRRAMYVTHSAEKEGPRVLMNCIQPGSYIRPHKHTNSRDVEMLMPWQGDFTHVLFDDEGNIIDRQRLGRMYFHFIEVPTGIYHTIVSHKNNSILVDISQGSHNPNTFKTWPDWAPEEGTPEGVEYLEHLEELVLERR